MAAITFSYLHAWKPSSFFEKEEEEEEEWGGEEKHVETSPSKWYDENLL